VTSLAILGTGAVVLAGGAVAIGFSTHRRAMRDAQFAYAQVVAREGAPLKQFELREIAELPEIAQRYFRHAITPGTPLYTVAELEMEGTFLLGDKQKFHTYQMSARQALRPPDQFVWIPNMRSGAMTISGSDALVRGEAWTRFWLSGLVPVAQERTSPDLVRSAQFRAAVEGALWLPASMLPENGVRWEQVGVNEARVTLRRFQPEIVLHLKLDETGKVSEVIGERWSNANSAKVFRLQPFGGTMLAEASFQGFTIPAEVAVGNHYGTEDYLPFFQARITKASYC
jgi:hypothetical protein